MTARQIELAAGRLSLSIREADLDLDALCGFASRANRKRGFLFVSKVLGKHIPVAPAVMEDAFARLAAKVDVAPSPLVVIGLAETATGLGHGVFEHIVARTELHDALFLHTTRHLFAQPLALEFLEPHSHAPQQRLYLPTAVEHARLLRQAQNLILVDDELTTGVTLSNLACALREVCPHVAQLQIVSLKNWMSPAAEQAFRNRLNLPVVFHSLLSGTYAFEPDPHFHPREPQAEACHATPLDSHVKTNFGRFGVQQLPPLAVDVDALTRGLTAGARLLVLGTGEFHYPPFRLARQLALAGFDVSYQSTTRSPILLGHDIHSVCRFEDHAHEGLANYVYNVLDKAYDRVFIGYEVWPPPASHRLAAQIGGVPLHFRDAGAFR